MGRKKKNYSKNTFFFFFLNDCKCHQVCMTWCNICTHFVFLVSFYSYLSICRLDGINNFFKSVKLLHNDGPMIGGQAETASQTGS